MAQAKTKDRRVSRTRNRLAVTLRRLIQQKPLPEITVQDVLDEAGVSRSTFYAHFDDTEDLFLTDVDEFLQRMANWPSQAGEKSERLAAVREFFAHVGEAQSMRLALARSERLSDFFDLATEHFARGIERRLGEVPRSRSLAATEREATAQALAGALIAQLRWWVGRRQRPTAAQMDEWFHRFAWSGIPATALASTRGGAPPTAQPAQRAKERSPGRKPGVCGKNLEAAIIAPRFLRTRTRD